MCWEGTSCKAEYIASSNNGGWSPPTQAPWSQNDPRLTYFCGTSWTDASNTCKTWCPNADNSANECPYGQSCYSDTTCKKTNEPTSKPTPSKSPTQRPTGPSQSPMVDLIPDSIVNHMFCGNDVELASKTCSLDTHCPLGMCNERHLTCWHAVPNCDVRDYISYKEGGYMDRPTHKEIAKEMGLTYPSDDPTDHYFCGSTVEQASKHCALPCKDKSALSCNLGEYCFGNTPCDWRVMPGYGITLPPGQLPTPSPLPYDAKENYMFCGVDWGDANERCGTWCGNKSGCPHGQR